MCIYEAKKGGHWQNLNFPRHPRTKNRKENPATQSSAAKGLPLSLARLKMSPTAPTVDDLLSRNRSVSGTDREKNGG